jgi:diaminopimelate epimerase
VRFAKAHGLGNDFILVPGEAAPPEAAPWARRLCDRHLGIGGDGVVLHEPAPDGVRMRLLNADGSEAEISGNGLRCLAALAFRGGWAGPDHIVHTPPGPRPVRVEGLGGSRFRVTTDLGPPVLATALIPVAMEPPRPSLVDYPLQAAGRTVRITAVSFGNPHCVLLLGGPADDALIADLGPALERHPLFPRRTNVEFVSTSHPRQIRARFWERGVGPTRASGTGAASAAVAAILAGRAERRLRVECDGGTLDIDWPEGGSLKQTGEVEILFEGEWLP